MFITATGHIRITLSLFETKEHNTQVLICLIYLNITLAVTYFLKLNYKFFVQMFCIIHHVQVPIARKLTIIWLVSYWPEIQSTKYTLVALFYETLPKYILSYLSRLNLILQSSTMKICNLHRSPCQDTSRIYFLGIRLW